MSRIHEELKIYKHQQLMSDYNELQIRIKTHLFDIGDSTHKIRSPKPTVQELDQMMWRLFEVLQQDAEPMKKY